MLQGVRALGGIDDAGRVESGGHGIGVYHDGEGEARLPHSVGHEDRAVAHPGEAPAQAGDPGHHHGFVRQREGSRDLSVGQVHAHQFQTAIQHARSRLLRLGGRRVPPEEGEECLVVNEDIHDHEALPGGVERQGIEVAADRAHARLGG